MTALLPNDFPPGPIREAYDTCLDLESRATTVSPPRTGPSVLICARFLGYMIREAPFTSGCKDLAQEVTSYKDDATLCSIAKLYIEVLVHCFKATKCRTPASSHHTPRSPSNEFKQDMIHLLKEAPRNHQTAKKMALDRDGYRCMISGKFDSASYIQLPSVQAAFEADDGSEFASTKAAHIIPEPISSRISWVHKGSDKRHYASSIWAVLDGCDSLSEELSGPGIHRLENIMTMDLSMHDWFSSLQIWLETTEVPNSYMLKSRYPALIRKFPAIITFTSTDNRLPLPSPRYIGIHAACARVVHLSGAGKYIDGVFRDLEEMRMLATDGTSGDVLSLALSRTSISMN
ncbi:hypothetical protein FRC03_000343 [Tulasnella sp. 419]|nr:hypothetical protein FRC03_000343 [Tulasnella sp. 419]